MSANSDDSEPPVEERIVQTNEGVKVECKSKRGTDTRHQDTVTAYQYYDDAEQAYDNKDMLTTIVRSHMRELRQMDVDGKQ